MTISRRRKSAALGYKDNSKSPLIVMSNKIPRLMLPGLLLHTHYRLVLETSLIIFAILAIEAYNSRKIKLP
ncbi:hypothetical protein RRG08_025922 [Elysia crispata]|uniref:Uncharacterized protein n=1 Tax=Elysia crispata TaxID=231223 RepID=A0AAE1DQG9_9GAST|nr:hypothetical protein RRG08_025922 [Elysia crispata]